MGLVEDALVSYVLEWVDAVGSLLDFTSESFWDQLANQLLQRKTTGFPSNNFHHLLSDLADLGGLCVGSLLNLIVSFLSESNHEETDQVVVGGLDNSVGFDQCLPLSYQRS